VLLSVSPYQHPYSDVPRDCIGQRYATDYCNNETDIRVCLGCFLFLLER